MQLTTSRAVYNYLNPLLTSEVEEFWIIALRSNLTLIRSECLFRGTVDSCPIHPRDVFRFAILHNASVILVAHNHPSLDSRPSAADTRITRQLITASRLLQIPLVDHIIIGGSTYWSYADRKLLGLGRARVGRR